MTRGLASTYGELVLHAATVQTIPAEPSMYSPPPHTSRREVYTASVLDPYNIFQMF